MTDIRTGITSEPLDAAAITQAAADPRCGALVTLAGVVRNHDAGTQVQAIDYSAHPSAERVLARIAAGIGERDGLGRIEAWHRIGHLEVGDTAMVVVVAAPHRGPAFAAVTDLVDQVKAELPVWKNQQLADGTHSWSGIA